MKKLIGKYIPKLDTDEKLFMFVVCTSYAVLILINIIQARIEFIHEFQVEIDNILYR